MKRLTWRWALGIAFITAVGSGVVQRAYFTRWHAVDEGPQLYFFAVVSSHGRTSVVNYYRRGLRADTRIEVDGTPIRELASKTNLVPLADGGSPVPVTVTAGRNFDSPIVARVDLDDAGLYWSKYYTEEKSIRPIAYAQLTLRQAMHAVFYSVSVGFVTLLILLLIATSNERQRARSI